MKNVIENKKPQHWDDMTTLTPEDYVINQHIHKLDQVAVEYEARWGCGTLERLASESLNQKWNAQKQKLDDAIRARDPARVAALVEGAIRGYAALEADAIKNGHTHNPPEWWDVRHESGRVYRILKNEPASRAAAKASMQDGVVVYTLQEVARILDNAQATICGAKAPPPAQIVPTKPPCQFDKGGDEMPF